MPIGMDPCLVFGLGSMLASEILWHMLHHMTMPFRIDYGFRVFGMPCQYPWPCHRARRTCPHRARHSLHSSALHTQHLGAFVAWSL